MTAPDEPSGIRPFADLSSTGLLWLINRVVFHPRGLALAVAYDDHGHAFGWRLVGDGAEPMWFSNEDDITSFIAACATLDAALTGDAVQEIVTDQPVPRTPVPPPPLPPPGPASTSPKPK